MKKYFLVLILFLTISISAQSSRVGWLAKFGIAGGPTVAWVSPNISSINNYIYEFGVPEFNNSGLVTFGGSGYVYTMIIDNVRIGGLGYSGSNSSTKDFGNYSKEAKYSISGGGISLEYTIPSIKKIALSAGAIIGWGSMDIELFQNNGTVDWQKIWNQYSSDKNLVAKYSKISNTFWSFTPTLNADIPFTRFVALRLGTGYNFTFANSWNYDNNQSLSKVPEDIKADNLFFQVGLFIGFFGF